MWLLIRIVMHLNLEIKMEPNLKAKELIKIRMNRNKEWNKKQWICRRNYK